MTRHQSPSNQIHPGPRQREAGLSNADRPGPGDGWNPVREWHGHFAGLLSPVPEQQDAQDITLNLDPGKKTTGVAVVINRPEGTAQVIAASSSTTAARASR